jgi:hypothetical protein
VKRWQSIGLAGVAAIGLGYLIFHRQPLGLPASHSTGADNGASGDSRVRPATIQWQQIDRSGDGFKIEMPVDVKQIRIPAYTETGATQQVEMIFSNPDPETTFSVTWQDDPPVARATSQAPDKLLEMARDGAVARTQTTLVSEQASNTQGFPGRSFEARNTGGGVMNAQLVYAGHRLYMLVASFPSVSARRDKDVARFFHSFAIVSTDGKGPGSSGDASKPN